MGVSVMIVDDDNAVRYFHRVIVTQSGLSAEPLSFSNGMEAYQHLEQAGPLKQHLILLDINMPVMNGWELLDAIREKPYSNQVFVVMVTSSVDKADHEKSKLYNMVIGFVEKPISVEGCKKIIHSQPMAALF